MHGRFPIANADFLYVLSTFIYEPIRWIERFGWRRLTPSEKLAFFNYYCALGRRMHIRDIPAHFDQFERYNLDYEREHFRYAPSNRVIGAITRDLLLSFYLPKDLFPLARPVVHALMDAPLRQAMGFPAPPWFLRRLATGVLRGRAWILRWLPERRHPRLLTQVRRPTYPKGYEIEALGTFKE
jgi:ER-bound oxygenase mpaB/B'/Rubber oxygenase, catalytic domain